MSERNIIQVAEADRNALAGRIRVAMGDESQRSFASRIGVGHATLRQYLLGQTEPSWSTLLAIAEVSGLSISWLMTGIGSAPQEPAARHSDEDMIEIARYPVAASAGCGEQIFEDAPPKVWRVPREMLRGYSGNYSMLASTDVRGDSMVPTLEDGDPIIFDRSIRAVDQDGVFVITIDNELFVKRMRKLPTPQGRVAITLLSDNPDYDAITLDHDAQNYLRIHGRVIWPDTKRRLRGG